jgi:hypothetical protein
MKRRLIMRDLKWVVIFVILSLVGCSKSRVHYGEVISDKVAVVKLKEIVEHPGKYKDKEVVLEGNFAGSCCATDFNYKEGLEMIEVYPIGFPNPKLDRGKPIRVYGIVRSTEKMTYIEAKGVESK